MCTLLINTAVHVYGGWDRHGLFWEPFMADVADRQMIIQTVEFAGPRVVLPWPAVDKDHDIPCSPACHESSSLWFLLTTSQPFCQSVSRSRCLAAVCKTMNNSTQKSYSQHARSTAYTFGFSVHVTNDRTQSLARSEFRTFITNVSSLSVVTIT